MSESDASVYRTQERATRPARRSLLRTTAWATPIAVASFAAPAYAASTCTVASQTAITDAFAKAASRAGTLEVNSYQAVQSQNGNVGESYLNIKNTGGTQIPYTASTPLVLKVEFLALSGRRSDTRDKSFIAQVGAWDRIGFDPSRGIEEYRWTITETIPASFEKSIHIYWRSGATAEGIMTNAVRVTPLTSGEPTLQSILAGAADQRVQCRGVYEAALPGWRGSALSTRFAFRGPLSSGALTVGSSVRTDAMGDYHTRFGGDGIY